MEISFMYNFICDPDLKIGKEVCRRKSYVYLTCLEILKLRWDVNNSDNGQPRLVFNIWSCYRSRVRFCWYSYCFFCVWHK